MNLAYALFADRGLVCLRSRLPLISAEAPVRWCDVAYEGEWLGHQRGPFEFTRERFEQAVKNHERQINPAKLDFDHETDYAPPGTSVPARGWVHKLEVRDGGDGLAHLWALIEFGPEAVRKNQLGGYRFTSGVFDFESIDRKSGQPIGLSLLRVALTDDPFVDGQAPTILSQRAAQGASMSGVNKAELMKQLRQYQSETVTADDAHKLTTALALLAEVMGGGEAALAEKPGDKPAEEPAAAPATPEEEDPKKKPMSAAPAPVTADFTGAPPASTDEPAAMADPNAAPPPAAPAVDPAAAEAAGLASQLMEQTGMDLAALCEALKSMMSGGLPAMAAPLSARVKQQDLLIAGAEHALAAANKRATDAETALRAYREREADAEVGNLVKSGRLLDNGKDFARELCLSDRKAFDRYVASLPVTVPMGEHAASLTPPTEVTPQIDEGDAEVARLRVRLSGLGIPKAMQDEKIRERILARKTEQTRA